MSKRDPGRLAGGEVNFFKIRHINQHLESEIFLAFADLETVRVSPSPSDSEGPSVRRQTPPGGRQGMVLGK